jgi:hypothetical protein
MVRAPISLEDLMLFDAGSFQKPTTLVIPAHLQCLLVLHADL